jgi:hypothetical protein
LNIFQCDSGYFGIDCSIPSAHSLAYVWPSWLHSPVNSPDLRIVNSTSINVKAIVQKKRPLIYVYDLPAEFDNHLLEVSLCHKFFLCVCSLSFAAALRLLCYFLQGRHFKLQCVNRIYDGKNRTLWTNQLYGAQVCLSNLGC